MGSLKLKIRCGATLFIGDPTMPWGFLKILRANGQQAEVVICAPREKLTVFREEALERTGGESEAARAHEARITQEVATSRRCPAHPRIMGG